jgi:hypothetical protein
MKKTKNTIEIKKVRNIIDLRNIPTLNIKNLEREILKALINSGKTHYEISNLTGISLRTLYRKLKLYGINDEINKSIKLLKKSGYKVIKM